MIGKAKQLKLFANKRKPRRGRPRIHDVGIAHVRRPSVSPKIPVHVTLRMESRVWSLRSKRCFRIVERALFMTANGRNAQIVHFSVQGNHIHLLVEADDKRSLSRAMRSLAIRIARGINALMATSGKVVAHRYHARALRTPTEVRNALGYVRHNFRHHAARRSEPVRLTFVDPYSSDALLSFRVPSARTWLLADGWRRAGPAPIRTPSGLR